MTSNSVISWVVGRGGLLGRNVELALGSRGDIWHPERSFTWQDSQAVERELAIACQGFATDIGDSPWQIAWCAGAGVVASGSTALAQETRAFGSPAEERHRGTLWTGKEPWSRVPRLLRRRRVCREQSPPIL